MTTPVSSESFLATSPLVPIAGQSDGVFVHRDTGGLVALRNSEIVKVLDPSTFCEVFEDFIGKALNVTDSVWGTKDTSSAGSPVLAILGDSPDGALQLLQANTDESEILTLYWNNELNIEPAKSPIVVFRLQIQDLLEATDSLVFGLASAQNDTLDSVVDNAWFRIESGGTVLLESDDGSTDNDDKAPDTALVLAVDTYYEFMVDATNYLDVKFYYRSSLAGDWTELTSAGVTFKLHATNNLQPFVQLQKSGGTQTTGILIDYVRAIWKRS